MITTRIPWQYHIALRQTVPVFMGLLGCLALMLSLGYFYAREEILSTTRAQIQQFVKSIVLQDNYSRQWIVHSMPTLVHAIERQIATNTLEQALMDTQIISAISDARGEQFLEIHYLDKGKIVSRYYCKDGLILKEKAQKVFAKHPTKKQLTQATKAFWSEPQVDENRTLHIRYTVPLHNADGNTIGQVTLSLAKFWLTEHIRSFSFFEQCIPFFLTAQGQWTLQAKANDSLYKLKTLMQEQKSGIQTVLWQGIQYVVIFMPSGEENLLLGILIPRKDIFGDLDTNAQVLLLMGIIILLVATYALYTTNKNFHTPLQQLLLTAETLAKGTFDTPRQALLPSIRTDETALLYKAMQRLHIALHQRMHDLTIMAQTRERLQGELYFARSIQTSLRPRTFPNHENLEVAAFVQESREVCGDMYDCFALSEHEICVIIGNVPEHGIPAALLTNRIMPVLHELMLDGFSPAKALDHTNNLFTLDKSPNTLRVNTLVGILHMQTGEFTWASAGQLPPYILPSAQQQNEGQEFYQLTPSAHAALGSHTHATYTQQCVQILAGQSLLFVPQRLLSLPSPQGELYNEKALGNFLRNNADAPEPLLHALFDHLSGHMQRVLREDMILFALRYAEKKEQSEK